MPVPVRRLIYGLLAALGFVMMIPLMVTSRRLGAELGQDAIDLQAGIQWSATPGLERQSLLFFVGLTLAVCFLYAALSVGSPKGWRPRENGAPRCSRCSAEIPFGVANCPACDQRQVW